MPDSRALKNKERKIHPKDLLGPSKSLATDGLAIKPAKAKSDKPKGKK